MKITRHNWTILGTALVSLFVLILFAGCVATPDARSKFGTVPEYHTELGLGALEGYLGPKALANSLALIPPPPAPGSAALAHDEEVARNTFALATRRASR
jgi:acid phosphatase (class A)